MTRAGRTFAAAVLAAGLALAAGADAAAAQTRLEYSVKANYLVRFAAFVSWPARAFAGPQAPVTICVAGRDPFGAALDTAARSQTAYGRRLAVRRLRDPAAVAGCHIVYVGAGGDAVLTAAAGQPMMAVTDEAAGRSRGVVHFVIADGRVRFHIDQQQAGRNGLGLSSRLLNLAVSVRPD